VSHESQTDTLPPDSRLSRLGLGGEGDYGPAAGSLSGGLSVRYLLGEPDEKGLNDHGPWVHRRPATREWSAFRPFRLRGKDMRRFAAPPPDSLPAEASAQAGPFPPLTRYPQPQFILSLS